MRRYYVLIVPMALALLGVVACQAVQPGTGRIVSPVQENTASSEKANPFDILRMWAPDAGWEPITAVTNPEELLLPTSEGTQIAPTGTLRMLSMRTSMDATTMQQSILAQRTIVSRLLEDAGWSPTGAFDADGATGERYGFQMSTPAGNSYVLVDRHGEDCVASSETPPTCSQWIFDLWLTAENQE